MRRRLAIVGVERKQRADATTHLLLVRLISLLCVMDGLRNLLCDLNGRGIRGRACKRGECDKIEKLFSGVQRL